MPCTCDAMHAYIPTVCSHLDTLPGLIDYLGRDQASPTLVTPPLLLYRVCPGQSLAMAEMKVFLATLARGYTFTADTDTDFASVPMAAPKNGLPMTVAKLAST